MSLPTAKHIAPEVFEQAKRDSVALRQAAMKKLVDDLWRVMTTPLALPVATAKVGRPCFPY